MSEISDLFAKDPLHLTVEDRAKIIAKFRENRASYIKGEKVAKEKKPAPAKGSISLGDLEL